jgi:hypothetical protein
MLINKPIEAQSTITIKTTGGDEVVARFVEEDSNTITIKKPLALMVTQNGIGLGPWVFTADVDDNIQLNKSTIVFYTKTDKDMANQYMTSTTGLAMA